MSIVDFNKLYDLEYANLYFKQIYDTYGSWRATISVTYYSLDFENSTFDRKELENGSAEFVGKRSGWKWNKIYIFLVHAISEISLATNMDENGMNQRHNIEFAVGGKFGLRPSYNDIIVFENHLNSKKENVDLTYRVTGIEKISPGEGIADFRCMANYYNITIPELESQVSNEFIFVPYNKKIYNYEDGSTILNILKNKPEIENELWKLIDNRSGLLLIGDE